MNTYVLLQSPTMHGETSPQIIILDNSDKIGKKKVEGLIVEGYRPVGTIESEYRPRYLKLGFESVLRLERELARQALKRTQDYLEAVSELLCGYLPTNSGIRQELLMANKTTEDKIINEFLQFAEGVTEDDG